MAVFCTRCGSRSHEAYDCGKPDGRLLAPVSAAAPVERAARRTAEPLLPARWPGGPPVCAEENRPAFQDPASCAEYRRHRCPEVKLEREWKCSHCGLWHWSGTGPSPSGATSGAERTSKYPRVPFVSFIRKSAAVQEAEPDLPKREAPPKAERKAEPPKPAKARQVKVKKGQSSLF